MIRGAQRKTWARLSYLVFAPTALGLFVIQLALDPDSALGMVFHWSLLVLLVLFGLHGWYFREELSEMRREWVERRPWLRHVVKTEAAGATPFMAQGLVWLLLGVVILTVLMTFLGSAWPVWDLALLPVR